MPHTNPSQKSHQKTAQKLSDRSKGLLPLDQLREKYAASGSLARHKIHEELDMRLEALEDLDFPDVATLTVKGQPIELMAQLLNKSPKAIKDIQREINLLLAA